MSGITNAEILKFAKLLTNVFSKDDFDILLQVAFEIQGLAALTKEGKIGNEFYFACIELKRQGKFSKLIQVVAEDRPERGDIQAYCKHLQDKLTVQENNGSTAQLSDVSRTEKVINKTHQSTFQETKG